MIVLSAGGYTLELAPGIGGAITAFRWRGAPVLRETEAPAGVLDTGCFPLVSYCNRIRGGRFAFRGRIVTIAPNMAGDPSPLHGDGWLAHWRSERIDESEAVLRFEHRADAWPWDYEARQRFRLGGDGLTAEIACTNRTDSPMPCGLGFHPYFPCDPTTRIETRVDRLWEVDEQVLPTTVVPATGRYALDGTPACGRGLDNGYGGWGGVALLRYGDGRVVRMASPDAGFFQLYSPPAGGLVVAEPVSHANAALNEPEDRWGDLGLRVLAPGETMRLRMTIGIVADDG